MPGTAAEEVEAGGFDGGKPNAGVVETPIEVEEVWLKELGADVVYGGLKTEVLVETRPVDPGVEIVAAGLEDGFALFCPIVKAGPERPACFDIGKPVPVAGCPVKLGPPDK